MANKKISELPAITTPTTADLVPVVQSGTTDQITRGNFLKNIDADATLTDITTNNASTAKHGFLKKLDNNAAHFMDGTGAWSTPSASYTDEQAQDAVGTILDNGTVGDINFTYDDPTPKISGVVKNGAITEAKQTLADNTTNDVSTSKHGYAPKAPNDATKYLDGTGAWTVPAGGGGSDICAIEVVIGDGVNVIPTGVAGDVEVPFGCTINRVTMLADQSGSIVVDIWKDTYANYPPTVADTITASAKPTITTATKSQDATLTGWTTAITAGDTLRFNVDSATTVTRVVLSLKVTR